MCQKSLGGRKTAETQPTEIVMLADWQVSRFIYSSWFCTQLHCSINNNSTNN